MTREEYDAIWEQLRATAPEDSHIIGPAGPFLARRSYRDEANLPGYELVQVFDYAGEGGQLRLQGSTTSLYFQGDPVLEPPLPEPAQEGGN